MQLFGSYFSISGGSHFIDGVNLGASFFSKQGTELHVPSLFNKHKNVICDSAR